MKTKIAVDDALARLSRAIDRPWDSGALPSYEDTPSPITRFVNRWTKPAFTGTLPLNDPSPPPTHPDPAYPTEDPDLPTPHRRPPPRPDGVTGPTTDRFTAVAPPAEPRLSTACLTDRRHRSARDFEPVEPPNGDYLFLADGPHRSRPTHTIDGDHDPDTHMSGRDQPSPDESGPGTRMFGGYQLSLDESSPGTRMPCGDQPSPDEPGPHTRMFGRDQLSLDEFGPGTRMPCGDQPSPDEPGPHTRMFGRDQLSLDEFGPGTRTPRRDQPSPDEPDPDDLDLSPRRRLLPRVPRSAAILAVLVGALLAGFLALPSAPNSSAEPPAPIPLAAEQPARTVTVDVQGKVRRPGLRHLPEGARVHDAIKASGGPLPNTNTSTLNLARRLTDGEQIHVGTPPTTADPAKQPLTNLNTAPVYQLDALPGVGIVTAQRIVEYRNRQPFTTIDQLRQIEGIGPTRYSRLKDLVTIS